MLNSESCIELFSDNLYINLGLLVALSSTNCIKSNVYMN